MNKRKKRLIKAIVKKTLPIVYPPIVFKSYDEFLAGLTPEQIAQADEMMRKACEWANDLPPIILVSRDPDDAKHLRKVKIKDFK